MSKTFSHFSYNRQITALAPMDGFTDCAFRQIIKKYSNPDLLFTEFVNARGLLSAPERLIETLRYTEFQRPIIAQLFGKEPEYFYKAAMLCLILGFDGIDINMGCPAKNVASHGGGAALIKKRELARELIKSVQKARRDYLDDRINYYDLEDLLNKKISEWGIKIKKKREITISVKTRLGYEDKSEALDWISYLSDSGIDFLTIHARTYKQKYKGEADWKTLDKIAKQVEIPIIGNGDIDEYAKIQKYKNKFGLAGIMIGRASVGNPYIFRKDRSKLNLKKTKKIVLEHAVLYKEFKSEKKFYEMRKVLVHYFKGIKGASKLRKLLVTCSSINDLKHCLKSI